MVELSYPGVYVQEIPSGARPIAASATSKAVFVGKTEMGPETPQHLTSWEEYLRLFGGFAPAPAHLAHGVFQFFNNGGQACYVLRGIGTSAARADATARNHAGETTRGPGLTFTARSPGLWGNSLLVSVAPATTDPGNDIRISVRRAPGNDLTGAEMAQLPVIESHDDLSLDPDDPDFVGTVLQRDSSVISASTAAGAVSPGTGVHRGGAPLDPTTWEAGWPALGRLLFSLDGAPFVSVPVTVTDATRPTTVEAAIALLTAAIEAVPGVDLPATFEIAASSDRHLEFRSRHATAARRAVLVRPVPGEPALADLLGFGSRGSRPSEVVSPYRTRRPAFTQVVQADGTPVDPPQDRPYRLGRSDDRLTAFTAGTEGATWPGGSLATDFAKLDHLTDVGLLAVPGQDDRFDEGVGYCERRPLHDIFFIGDCPRTNASDSDAKDTREKITKPNGLGALYFPWILARDPSGATPGLIELPPSGFVAGIYARIDSTRGVWKAPAGLDASLSGAVGLKVELSDQQHGRLNLAGVNVIRRFAIGGLVLWGARTVTSDPRHQYVSVRRTQSMIQRSVYDGLQSAVFQPNNSDLWSSLRADVGSFLNTLFRAGAFQGETASQAYFVRCGLGDTMIQADVDRGIVIVDVGFAPLKPAEFVVVRIQHHVAQS
jgi:phage tail sheath protein FI